MHFDDPLVRLYVKHSWSKRPYCDRLTTLLLFQVLPERRVNVPSHPAGTVLDAQVRSFPSWRKAQLPGSIERRKSMVF